VDPPRYQQIKSILAAALELPLVERDAFLAAACGDDGEIRSEVESLLDFETDEEFLKPVLDATFLIGVADRETFGVGSADTDPLIGDEIGSYRVINRLGEGGMGVVYLADDVRLGRRAALKFLRPEFLFDEQAKARFMREARAIAALDHPNICTLYGIEEIGPHLFLAMAFYNGETLGERLKRGSVSVLDALDLAVQIGNGLEAAHRAGIVHRDIKPSNLTLVGRLVKILDFGIAKLSDQVALTVYGATLGTKDYRSPEQAVGGRVDHRTDIWSLGVVLYEMLAGRRPFESDQLTRADHVATPPSIRTIAPEAPAELEAILRKSLSIDPTARYETMSAMVNALNELSERVRLKRPVVIAPAERGTSVDHGLDRHSKVHVFSTEYGFTDALARFEREAAATPQDARLWAQVAEACIGLAESDCDVNNDRLASRARRALARAIELEPGANVDVILAAGNVAFKLDGSLKDAEAHFRRVLELQPGNPHVMLRLAECLIAAGERKDAISAALRVEESCSNIPALLNRVARVFFYAADYRSAARVLREAIAALPGATVARIDLALTLAKLGDLTELSTACDLLIRVPEAQALMIAATGNAARSRGDLSTYGAANRFLRAFDREHKVPRCCFALLETSFGDTGRPLEYLDVYDQTSGLGKFLAFATIAGSLSAIAQRVGLVAFLGIEPEFDRVYDTPALQVLFEKLRTDAVRERPS
jgi:serine/threonine-protein kinase